MQIFLSYASEEKTVAELIAFSLRARGHKVFLDQDDLPPGDEFEVRIQNAIYKAQLFIFLLSPRSITKGRFTLTELEFARQKWRTAHGYVLPVIIEPVEMRRVPSFLRSVTILNPKGNVAAEVALAVQRLRDTAVRSSALIYGTLGCISGFLTFPLQRLFFTLQPPCVWMPGCVGAGVEAKGVLTVHGVPVAMILSGIAFAAAISAPIIYFNRFHLRQLTIPASVLMGWFIAMNIEMHTPVWPTEPTNQNEETTATIRAREELKERCRQLNKAELQGTDSSLEVTCELLEKSARAEARLSSSEAFWKKMLRVATAGTAGAIITAIGIAVATLRPLTVLDYIVITMAGALIAGGWFAIFQESPASVYVFFMDSWGWITALIALYVTWQGAIAAIIGRSVR